ncbi:hypothetical protein GCM10017774_59980 [Lentzea cavernae]|uniref:Uncharacterized protein n=1 Tax=Lentzea cavernae TaxID=2020703 RepID=A0ABQ3MSA7_9PSEU|nr:hypothetical protein GCM10017774_59980 [Lentzea cavernae]
MDGAAGYEAAGTLVASPETTGSGSPDHLGPIPPADAIRVVVDDSAAPERAEQAFCIDSKRC